MEKTVKGIAKEYESKTMPCINIYNKQGKFLGEYNELSGIDDAKVLKQESDTEFVIELFTDLD